jgi:hypothetical protein
MSYGLRVDWGTLYIQILETERGEEGKCRESH